MNEYRFLNPSQPQTLVNATILCYIEAFFGLIGSRFALTVRVILIAVGARGVGGFGIANEKRWGYGLALGAAVLNVVGLALLLRHRRLRLPDHHLVRVRGAARRLLVHPMSRDYQRIWFR